MHGTLLRPEESRPLSRCANEWTLREHGVVMDHWPDIAAIRAKLPHRSIHGIRSFATKCNIRKPLHVWTESETQLLKRRVREMVPRKAIAHELGLTELQVQNRMQYLKLSYGRRPPPVTGNKLMDAIRRRAFDLNMSMAELDEACGSGKAFRKWAPSRSVPARYVPRAVEYMEGELVVEWAPLAVE